MNNDSLEERLSQSSEFKIKKKEVPEIGILRHILLITSCIMLFGVFYAYDTPYAVKFYLRDVFATYELSTFNYMFATMMAVYDVPNIVLPLVNNYLGYKLGNRKMMTLYLYAVCAGIAIINFGVFIKNFYFMILGRFIYGLGGDSLIVAQFAYASEYFDKDEMGLVSGIINTFVGISESANLYFNPILVQHFELMAAFHFTLFLCILSLLARFILMYLEGRSQNKHNIDSTDDINKQLNVELLLPTRQDFQFPTNYYVVLTFAVTCTVSRYGYYYLAYDFLEQTWYSDLGTDEAQSMVSIYNSMGALIKTIGLLILGYISDKYHLNAHFAVLAPIVLIFAYTLPLVIPPLVPFILFGLGGALSIISSWTSLTLVLEEKKLLLGGAVMYSMENALFAFIQYINPLFYEIDHTFRPAIYFLVALNLLGLLGALKFYKIMHSGIEYADSNIDKEIYIEME